MFYHFFHFFLFFSFLDNIFFFLKAQPKGKEEEEEKEEEDPWKMCIFVESQGHLSLPDLPPYCAAKTTTTTASTTMGINRISREKEILRGRHDDDETKRNGYSTILTSFLAAIGPVHACLHTLCHAMPYLSTSNAPCHA